MSLTRFTTRLSAVRIPARQFSISTSKMADKSNLDANNPNSIGREFESDGKIGSAGQKVGGPFAADGTVGKEFTKQGSIGGKAQEMAESKSVFDKDGAVGKEFQADGKIGQVGEAVGGPFSKDGAIGKQFTDKGAVGGTVQENLGSKKS
ncbi:hypothetical protein CB0940_09871 [Cercospora beticola]|uniref:Uncharacterized protein n=1 Tax=Cercospora beticola TaxID=122368 RepID=A0A2G5HHH9_CERBT|nr:hypothetical protein CB0940_09871 [Cercospora beticola]PIA92014.1 hypothetical protein CB0940_09871 [Cercospora beticola]WPB05782.1 hypothetical protein RHO25_010436 [Cercospora beticola]CAK1365635.1 unnamed protein product [Cercospora beticola]